MTKPGTNFVAPEKIQGFVSRLDDCDGRLASLKGTYMADCKVEREAISGIMDEAKDAGIPKRSLKAVMAARRAEAKAKAARDDLADMDLQDKFDLIRHALGELADTPLGAAAVKAA